MVISCSAYGCSNKWSKQTNIHFHKFPLKRKVLCDKWVSALKRKDFIPTTASIVCSEHFKTTDYIKGRGQGKRLLKKNAVPSKFKFPSLDKLSVDLALQELAVSDCATKFLSHSKRGRKKVEPKTCLKLNRDLGNSLMSELTTRTTEDDDHENDFPLSGNDTHEEDSELMHVDEEDKCFILGSIWGERLKLLPLNVRNVVRTIIDQIFEDARAGKLTDDYFS